MSSRECIGISILTALEAFSGYLYASFCGAILFAKVARAASHAQVIFSDPVVIRYGGGVASEDGEEEGSEEFEQLKTQRGLLSRSLPCPVLEFRLVNRLSHQIGGEIIDATLHIVARIEEKQAANTVRFPLLEQRRKKRRRGRQRTADKGLIHRNALKRVTSTSMYSAQQSVRSLFMAPKRNNQAIDEDPTGKLVPRRIISKLEIDSPDHPFFKRAWVAKHVIDHHSPLLRQEARELVRLNGGHWPEELNSADAVRASVMFDQILVSFSGVSNVDAKSVYAQKIYEYCDVCVGYRFVNILFKDRYGCLNVDQTLLNDVVEQVGGGGEELNVINEPNTAGVRFL